MMLMNLKKKIMLMIMMSDYVISFYVFYETKEDKYTN